jgi:hypothetical protein
MNAKIVAIKKIADAPSRVAVEVDSRATCNIRLSPSVVNQNDSSDNVGTTRNNVSTNENHACSSQSTSSRNACVRASANATGINVPVESVSVSNFLSSSELPLPLFDDNSNTNPIFHLRRLDEFIRLKGVPKHFQLVVAYTSSVGHMSKQWAQTVRRNLTDYEALKKTFLKLWWSASRQNLVNCILYQGKYNRNSNLCLSGHFLMYATMASYLKPLPTDVEVFEAIIYHFPIAVQRAMLITSCIQSRKLSIC